MPNEFKFWPEGESQLNYEFFGDVISFDATYQKNKYSCSRCIAKRKGMGRKSESVRWVCEIGNRVLFLCFV